MGVWVCVFVCVCACMFVCVGVCMRVCVCDLMPMVMMLESFFLYFKITGNFLFNLKTVLS